MKRNQPGEVPESIGALTNERRLALMEWLRREIDEGRLPRAYGDQRTRRRMAEACLDHHRARGNRAKIIDWPAAIRNWFRIAAEREGFQPAARVGRRVEKPQEPRTQPYTGGELVGDVLRVIQGGRE